MFSHTMMGTNDLPRAKSLCDTVLGTRDGSVGKLYLAYLRAPTATKSARCTAWFEGRP